MKKKTTLTKMHIAPSTVRYDAVAARDSNEVGQILAGTRKRNGYSLVTFSELLSHYGVDVSDKGISKWEKGYTTPSIYQLVAICYALNIKEGPSYFTKNFQKPALLNDIGQKKVAEYEMDLIASRRYQPDAEEPAEIDYIMMPVSELPVSAGLGAFLEGEMFQQIQVPASSVPAGAEFGIYVSGVFRNEGVDTRHNPEFTLMELSQAYTDYEGMMELTESMFRYLAEKVCGSTKISYNGIEIDLGKPFERLTMNDAIKKYAGIDFDQVADDEAAKKLAAEHHIEYEERHKKGDIINLFFEEYCEKELIQPTFIMDHPIEISPLTKKKPSDPNKVERFELFINTWEMCRNNSSYSAARQ